MSMDTNPTKDNYHEIYTISLNVFIITMLVWFQYFSTYTYTIFCLTKRDIKATPVYLVNGTTAQIVVLFIKVFPHQENLSIM